MKKLTGLVVLCLVLVFPMLASAVELGDGYSITPLENWKAQDFAQLDHKILVTTPVGDFTPNLNMGVQNFPGDLAEYVDLNFQQLVQAFKAEKISRTDFDAGNTKGIRLTTSTEIQGKKLRQTFYFFENSKGTKVVVTCTAPHEGGESFDTVFDTMLHTFRVN